MAEPLPNRPGRLRLAVLPLLLAASCAPPPAGGGAGGAAAGNTPAATPAGDVASRFAGMSSSALERCAGAPQQRSIDVEQGPTAYWIYNAPGCKASFRVAGNQVESARFTGPGEQPLTDLAACAPIIAGC